MHASSADRAASPGAELETCIAAVEQRLSAMAEALRDSNAQAIDQYASELHSALAVAIQRVSHAARTGGVPAALRYRLARASGQIAAQRESLARAIAALDRAIDVLLPDAAAAYAVPRATGSGDPLPP